MLRSQTVLFVVCAALSGCRSSTAAPETYCTVELGATFTPHDTTLSVGQRFTAAVALWTCGGKAPVKDTFTWASRDSAVATVEGQTGIVTAFGKGQTYLVATGAEMGAVAGLPITVR